MKGVILYAVDLRLLDHVDALERERDEALSLLGSLSRADFGEGG